MLKWIVFASFGILILGLLYSCSAKKSHKKSQEKASKTILVSTLRATGKLALKRPSEYCLKDGYIYSSTKYHADYLNIFSKTISDKIHEPLLGKAVVITGTMRNDLSKIIEKKEKCPPKYGEMESSQQIRSDWVGEETGFHIGHSTKEKLSRLSYFEYSAIRPFDGVKTYVENNKQIVVFQNTLEQKIDKLQIIAHYEGGWGKPQPGFVKREFQNLNSQEQIRVSFQPTLKDKNSRPGRPPRSKKFRSIIIKGSGINLKINLEIFTSFSR